MALEPLSINIEPELDAFLDRLAKRQDLPKSVLAKRFLKKGLAAELSDADSWKLFKSAHDSRENF